MDVIDRLYQKINEDPLTPKVLLVPTFAQGHQLVERLCKRYRAIFNIEVQTLRDLLKSHTKLELYRRQISFLDEQQAMWVVRKLMKQIAEEQANSYIKASMLKPGIVHQVHHAIKEIRSAGIHSDSLNSGQFTNVIKGEYIRRLLMLYEAHLEEYSQMDLAGLSAFISPREQDDTIYLAHMPMGWTYVEQLIIEQLTGNRLYDLSNNEPFYINDNFATNQFTMFRASGSLAEVREGLRRILSEPTTTLDQSEIILSNYEQYAPIVLAQSEVLEIHCTFSNGLPMEFCALGKALQGIMNWITEGYPVSKLTELIRHACLSFPDERWTRDEWIRLLENSGIGWSKERYMSALRPEQLDEADREQGAVLHTYMENLFTRLPEGELWNPLDLLSWLEKFAQNYVPNFSEDDVYVQATLKDMKSRFNANWFEPMPKELAIRYVYELLNDIRIRVSATPRSGAIHVSSLQNGGWSGRERTWIVGLGERAWSLSSLQDPLLLDIERTNVSEYLQLAHTSAKKARSERESRLAQIRGEVWLSYSSYDPGQQKTQGPAFEMLQVLRLAKEDQTLDFAALERTLGEPYAVMDMMHGSETSATLDEIDAWTQALKDSSGSGKRKDGQQTVLQYYATLTEGEQAKQFRSNEDLSVYDGWLQINPPSIPDKQVGDYSEYQVSVSQLEKYARCGMQYYFEYVLKLRPKNVAQYDPTRWLQASDKGTLMHDIFHKYLELVTDQGTQAPVHQREQLSEITEQVIADFASKIPYPNMHVFAKECAEIRRDIEVFNHSEQGNADQPCFFELDLSTADGEPMMVLLPNGIRIKLKGFVDRVDRIGPHQYRIIDYKTGNPSKYKDGEYFSGGTQLQHALYSIAVEQWLRESGIDAEARVMEAAYYFPTERGRGERVRRNQNRRDELSFIIAQLMESRSRGIYIPAKDTKSCKWCDYQAVCGSHAEKMPYKRESSNNADLLSRLLEVENIG